MKYFPACSFVRISSPPDLLEYAEDCFEDLSVALATTELVIALENPFSIELFRLCLSISSGVTDLILSLPSDVPDNLLVGLQLQHLQFLKANLPHGHLDLFLASHSTVTDLVLGPCAHVPAAGSCPLCALDLHHVTALECPIGCVSDNINPGLLRLTVETHGNSTPYIAPTLRSISPPLLHLFALTLDFYPDDYDILQNVALAAPRVQKLKLLEKPRQYRRMLHARRAWNDARAWAHVLKKLDFLEDFALRTASSITRAPYKIASEQKTLLKWTNTSSRATGIHEHPTLTFLRVWYRCLEPNGGITTCWSKTSGSWRNISRNSANPPDTIF
ncbi:hypothetical protein C8Q74DRAFT_1441953 [Fomes fomentarius]|nr:hypothetical protein C8Q74DRAFT_1441953 [Fomes fomentarius]